MKGKRTAIGLNHLPKRLFYFLLVILFLIALTEEAKRTHDQVIIDEILDHIDEHVKGNKVIYTQIVDQERRLKYMKDKTIQSGQGSSSGNKIHHGSRTSGYHLKDKNADLPRNTNGELFLPGQQNLNNQNRIHANQFISNQQEVSSDDAFKSAEQLKKVYESISRLIESQLNFLKHQDLEFLIQRGIIDESQAFLIWEFFVSKKPQTQNLTLTNELYLFGFIPLVYFFHILFFVLMVNVGKIHREFTYRIHSTVFIVFKLAEIYFFYFFALYLQVNKCPLMMTIAHFHFNITIQNLLIEILAAFDFRADQFIFKMKATDQVDHNVFSKIVFTQTMLVISYLSCLQFDSIFISVFFYWYFFNLVHHFASVLKLILPYRLQPFPYLALSLFSLFLLVKIYYDGDKTFKFFAVKTKADFSVVGTIMSLIVFQQTTFIFAYVQFFDQGKNAMNFSFKKLVMMKKEWFIPFSDDIPIRNENLLDVYILEASKISNMLVCLYLLFTTYALIFTGFYFRIWAFILTGLFMQLEFTRSFPKIFPVQVEAKLVNLSFLIALVANFLMGICPDQMNERIFRGGNEVYGELAKFVLRLIGFSIVFLTAKISIHPIAGKYLIKRKRDLNKARQDDSASKHSRLQPQQTSTSKLQPASAQGGKRRKQQYKIAIKEQKFETRNSTSKLFTAKSQDPRTIPAIFQAQVVEEKLDAQGSTELQVLKEIIMLFEEICDVVFGVYLLGILGVVFSDYETYAFLALQQIVIVCFFIAKTRFFTKLSAYEDEKDEKEKQEEREKLFDLKEDEEIVLESKLDDWASKDRSPFLLTPWLLYFIGIRLTLFSRHLTFFYFLFGLLINQSILTAQTLPNAHSTECLIFMVWLYFVHVCFLRSDILFLMGIITVTLIWLLSLKTSQNSGKSNSNLIILISVVILFVCIYLACNFSFSFFYELNETLWAEIKDISHIKPQIYNDQRNVFEKRYVLDYIDNMRTCLNQ